MSTKTVVNGLEPEDSSMTEDKKEKKIDESEEQMKNEKMAVEKEANEDEAKKEEEDVSDMEEFIVDDEVETKILVTKKNEGFADDQKKVEASVGTSSAPKFTKESNEDEKKQDEAIKATSTDKSGEPKEDLAAKSLTEIDVPKNTSESIVVTGKEDIKENEEELKDVTMSSAMETKEETASEAFKKVEVSTTSVGLPDIFMEVEEEKSQDEVMEKTSVDKTEEPKEEIFHAFQSLTEITVPRETSEAIKSVEKEEFEANEVKKVDTTSSTNGSKETTFEAKLEGSATGSESKEEQPLAAEGAIQETSAAVAEKAKETNASPSKQKKAEDKEKKRAEKEERKREKELKRKEKEEKKKAKEEQKAAKKRRSSFDEALASPDKKKKKHDKKEKPQFVGGLPMAPIQHEPVVPNLYNYDPMAEIMPLGTGQLQSAYRRSRDTVAPPSEKKFYKLEHKPSEERREEEAAGSTTPTYSGREATPVHSPSQPTPTLVTATPVNFGQRRSGGIPGYATTSGVTTPQAERRPSFDQYQHNTTPRSSGIAPQPERRPSFEHGHGYVPQGNVAQMERRPAYVPTPIRPPFIDYSKPYVPPVGIANVPIPQNASPNFMIPTLSSEPEVPIPEPRRPKMTPREFAAMLDAKREVLDALNRI